MTKIVINACFGGFGLSDKACEKLINEYNWKVIDADVLYNLSDEEIEKLGKHLIIRDERSILTKLYRIPYHLSGEIRDDPDVVAVVEELRREANAKCAELKVVEIPDDVEWEIEEYDGNEWVSEKHRRWW